MLIWTAKIDRRKVKLTLLLAAAVCAALGAFTLLRGDGAQASATVSPKGVRTAQDRQDYLAGWGWQVPEDAASVEELEMPEQFGAEYDQYLSLQSGQGFDLTRYAGKRIKRYTYEVLNYPGVDAGVRVHLLMYKNTVIGGEVLGDGFLHGLERPA